MTAVMNSTNGRGARSARALVITSFLRTTLTFGDSRKSRNDWSLSIAPATAAISDANPDVPRPPGLANERQEEPVARRGRGQRFA